MLVLIFKSNNYADSDTLGLANTVDIKKFASRRMLFDGVVLLRIRQRAKKTLNYNNNSPYRSVLNPLHVLFVSPETQRLLSLHTYTQTFISDNLHLFFISKVNKLFGQRWGGRGARR